MDAAAEELCLQKIGEFVYDEDKIVTATLLSRQLNISTQDCKILLKQFVQDHHDLNKDELSVTYVLCGPLREDKKFGVLLVKDTELNSKRALFQKISSESICTVQKGKEIDFNIVGLEYASELNNPEEKPLSGSIIDENCTKREVPKRAPNPLVVKNDAKPKQNLFANVPKKPQSNGVQKNDVKATTKPQTLPKKVMKNTANGIGSYFSKTQNEKKDKTEEIQLAKEEKAPSTLINEQNQSKPVHDVTEEPQPKKPKRVKNKTKHTKKESSKKRKRIVEADSSDSDDIFVDADVSEEEITTKSDSEEERPKAVIKVDMNAPKNKRRKLVDKTYTDEDGYILTKKEWVCVSDDESDNEKEQNDQKPKKDHKEPPIENETKMDEPKAPVKKNSGDVEIASTTKNKGKKSNKKVANQPTLLNFFKSK